MLAEEDLVGGGGGADIVGSLLDLDDAVEGGDEDHEEGGADGLHHDGAAAALDAIQPHEPELLERVLEEEEHDHRRLPHDHVEQ